MPSSLVKGISARSLTAPDPLRGIRYPLRPDFFISVPRVAAADIPGANSGFWVFAVPKPAVFLGTQVIWQVAGGGGQTARVKKVLAAATSIPGAAADANNVDISAVIDLSLSTNVRRDIAAVTADNAHLLALGDKVAIASATGAATWAGGLFVLQFAWL